MQPFYIGFFSDEISNSVVVATKFKAPVDTTCYIINTPPAAISCVKVYQVQWKCYIIEGFIWPFDTNYMRTSYTENYCF